MAGFLKYDGFLNQTLRKLADCFCLSFLWAVSCIPVITAGAATTALYYAVNKVLRYNRGGVWRDYWHAFRTNFKQATLVWLLVAVVYALLIGGCYCAYVLYAAGGLPKWGMYISLAVAAVILMWVGYLFPHIARFQCATGQLLKNCELMVLLNFFRSALLVAALAAAVAVVLYVPLALLFAPGVYMWVCSYILEPVFRKYMSQEDQQEEDIRNGTADP